MAVIKQNADNDEAHKFYIEGIVPAGTGIKPLKPDVLDLIKALLIEVMWYNHQQMKKQNERIKNKAIEILEYLHTKYHLNNNHA